MKYLVFGLVGLLAVSSAQAQSKCDALRWKFSAKAIFAKAKCEAKAEKKGIAVDPACVTKAEQKLADKWAKAAKKGDCSNADEMADALTPVDESLESLRFLVTAPFSGPSGGTCCAGEMSGIPLCLYTDASLCAGSFGGTPLVNGWCNVDGSCVAAATGAGDCCDGLDNGLGGTFCSAAGAATELVCDAFGGGTIVPDSVCTPTGCQSP